MTETELQVQIIATARDLGWKAVHWRPAMTSHGFRTAVQGDGVGWPDLTMVRDNRMICAELKSAGKQLAPAQEAWLDALKKVPGIEVYLWRPDQWENGAIVATLLRRVRTPI